MTSSRLRAATICVSGGIALWLLVGGAANSDARWALDWGRQLAGGHAPDLDAPGAPTPHPLTTLLGAALSPLGDAAAQAALVLGCLIALMALALIVSRLGSAWFGRAAGGLAALLLLTRPQLVSFSARAYLDVPYLALVLGALLIETRRPRTGASVVWLLAAAGLLRPEAWLFGALYLAWLARGPEGSRPALALAPIVLLAPIAWLAMDWISTGDPLHSLHGTQRAAVALGRAHGPLAAVIAIPGRLLSLLGLGLMAGTALASAAALRWRTARLTPAAPLAALAAAACVLVAAAGLPVIMRYVLLPGTLVILLCAGGALGWLALPLHDRRRTPWMVAAVVPLTLLAIQLAVADAPELMRERAEIAAQAPHAMVARAH